MMVFAKRLLFLMAPIFVMIGLIPLVVSDLLLLILYVLMSAAMLAMSKDKKEAGFFAFGFALLTVAEIFFVSTGVETFHRNVLFADIPVWLPVLWGYAFVMIRRGIIALDEYLG